MLLKVLYNMFYTEGVVQRRFLKKVFIEILQNSQENTCASVSFLIKLQVLGVIVLFLPNF